jgi:hypothetical protein
MCQNVELCGLMQAVAVVHPCRECEIFERSQHLAAARANKPAAPVVRQSKGLPVRAWG